MGRVRTPAGFTGGEDMAGAISGVSSLRIIPDRADSQPVRERQVSRSRLPEVGYLKVLRIVVEGELSVTTNTDALVAGNPFEFVRNLTLSVQNSTSITSLPGPMSRMLNDLDRRVLDNRSEISVDEGTNRFYIEFLIEPTINEQNLLGLIYAAGTYPYVNLTYGAVEDIVSSTGDGTAEIEFTDLNLTVYQERIDAEQPVSPRRVMVGSGENRREEYIEGQGLWEETSKYVQTNIERVVQCPGPRQQAMVDLPLGKRYLRIAMLGYRDGQVNAADDMIEGFELWVENNTRMAFYDRVSMDMFWRDTYYKERPGGYFVNTFIDRTASDRDILHTEDLGRLQLYIRFADSAPQTADGNEVYVALQQVVDLTSAAAY